MIKSFLAIARLKYDLPVFKQRVYKNQTEIGMVEHQRIFKKQYYKALSLPT